MEERNSLVRPAVTFSQKGLKNIYEESAHGGNKFDCWTCDYQSNHKGYLKVHKESVHAGKNFPENLPQVSVVGFQFKYQFP